MKLKYLLKAVPEIVVRGTREIEITGITSHSKYVAPGNIFVAKRGFKEDGIKYVPEAIHAGACAILADIYDPTLDAVQLVAPDVKAAEAQLAAAYYDFPAKKLWIVGVTGTNGKTTTTYGIHHVLNALQEKSGLIGTIKYVVGDVSYEAIRTTPDVCAMHRLLADMVRHGCSSCVMEVTSHALDQGRVDCIEYDVGVFVNLTHEHLDYHKTMQAYAEAKSTLFARLTKEGVAIVNNDDPWKTVMLQRTSTEIMTYGIEEPSDLMAKDISFSREGTRFSFLWQQELIPFSWSLVGRFNVYNALAICAVLLAKGIPLPLILEHLSAFTTVPGRLEKVPNELGLHIFVDYAHKPEALENVLKTLRECCCGKIITVFGCGGDRDTEKRPLMAKICERYSDVSIVTSDNPRSEDPARIAEEIAKGFTKNAYIIEIDRKEAIRKALAQVTTEDVVLIAGKGHETKQYFAHKTIDFDDREVVRHFLGEAVNAR